MSAPGKKCQQILNQFTASLFPLKSQRIFFDRNIDFVARLEFKQSKS